MRTKIVIEQTLSGKWFWRATFPKVSGLDPIASSSYDERSGAEASLWQALAKHKLTPLFPLDISVKGAKFRGFNNE